MSIAYSYVREDYGPKWGVGLQGRTQEVFKVCVCGGGSRQAMTSKKKIRHSGGKKRLH